MASYFQDIWGLPRLRTGTEVLPQQYNFRPVTPHAWPTSVDIITKWCMMDNTGGETTKHAYLYSYVLGMVLDREVIIIITQFNEATSHEL
jgi:hypothetical protein